MSDIIKNSVPQSVDRYAIGNLSDNDLNKIIRLIYQRAGIVITPQRRDMVYNRLVPRLHALGLNDFGRYLRLFENSPDHAEWQSFVNALTTNLTSFFREAYHFPILAEHARGKSGSYSVWCTAASTGEEPYSIAMTLDEALGSTLAGPRILATDIDTSVLDKARAGTYRLSDVINLTPDQKKKYFLRNMAADEQSQVKVRDILQKDIHFRQLNLIAEEWDVPAPFDAIFCRNVMIYFDKNNQLRLLKRFAKLLKPDGLLFVGHSEHFAHTDSPFRLQGKSVYYLNKDKV